MRYGLPSCIRVKTTEGVGGGGWCGLGGSEKNRGTVITSLQLAFRRRYKNFTPFTKLRWRWKIYQTHLASIPRVYTYLLLKQWFYTVSGPFRQIKSAKMHRWNIFLIEALSTLDSPQIKTVKPPDKKPGISDRSSFLRRRRLKFSSFGRNCVTTFTYSPGRAASKACWLTWFILRIPKILSVLAQDVPYGGIMKTYVL